MLLAASAALFAARLVIGIRSRGTEMLWDLLLALVIVGLLMFFLLAIPIRRARKTAEGIELIRPRRALLPPGRIWCSKSKEGPHHSRTALSFSPRGRSSGPAQSSP